MSGTSKRREILWIFLTELLTLPTVIYWHWNNRGYPVGDSAGYLWTSVKVYRYFLKGNLFSGIWASYFFRLWKPIFHPLTAVPALLLFRGHVLEAQALTLICLQGFLALALYKLARHYLPRAESSLAAGFLLNLHWMSSNANDLNSELPFILFFFAAWAALFGSEGFARRSATLTAALFMALAISTRPAEGVLLFSIPLAVFVAFAVRSGKLPRAELKWGLIEAAVCAAPPSLILFFHERFFWSSFGTEESGNRTALALVVAGVAVAALLHFSRRFSAHREQSTGAFRAFALVSVSLVALWFAPYLWHTMAWMQLASFQKGGVNVEERIGFLLMFKKLEQAFLGPGSLLLLSAALFFGCNKLAQKPVNSAAPGLRGVALTLLLTLGVHISLGARSYNGDVRYYMLEIAAAYLIALVMFLGPIQARVARPLVVLFFLGALMLTQFVSYGALGVTHFPSLLDEFGKRNGCPPWRLPDPALEIWNHIEGPIVRRGGKPMILSYPTQSDFQALMEPGRFFLISIEKGIELDITFPGPSLFVDWKTWHEAEKDHFDFYLLGPLERAAPSLLPEIERENYRETYKFQVVYDPTAVPATFMLINARNR